MRAAEPTHDEEGMPMTDDSGATMRRDLRIVADDARQRGYTVEWADDGDGP